MQRRSLIRAAGAASKAADYLLHLAGEADPGTAEQAA